MVVRYRSRGTPVQRIRSREALFAQRQAQRNAPPSGAPNWWETQVFQRELAYAQRNMYPGEPYYRIERDRYKVYERERRQAEAEAERLGAMESLRREAERERVAAEQEPMTALQRQAALDWAAQEQRRIAANQARANQLVPGPVPYSNFYYPNYVPAGPYSGYYSAGAAYANQWYPSSLNPQPIPNQSYIQALQQAGQKYAEAWYPSTGGVAPSTTRAPWVQQPRYNPAGWERRPTTGTTTPQAKLPPYWMEAMYGRGYQYVPVPETTQTPAPTYGGGGVGYWPDYGWGGGGGTYAPAVPGIDRWLYGILNWRMSGLG